MNWLDLVDTAINGGVAIGAWNLARKVQKSLDALTTRVTALEADKADKADKPCDTPNSSSSR